MTILSGAVNSGVAKAAEQAQLDTAPDSTGLAERRAAIRRGSAVFATPAGSETGAPGGQCQAAPRLKMSWSKVGQ